MIQNDHISDISWEKSIIFAPIFSIFIVFSPYDTILDRILIFLSCCVIFGDYFYDEPMPILLKNVIPKWNIRIKTTNLCNIPYYMVILWIKWKNSVWFLLNSRMKNMICAQFEIIIKCIIPSVMLSFICVVYQSLWIF